MGFGWVVDGLEDVSLVERKYKGEYVVVRCSLCGRVFRARKKASALSVLYELVTKHFEEEHRDVYERVLKALRNNGSRDVGEEDREKMKLISVHLPIWMLNKLERLVKLGIFPSRSEAIRVAIHLLLTRYSEEELRKKGRVELLPGR